MSKYDDDLLRGLTISGKQATVDDIERIWVAYDDGSMGEPRLPTRVTVQHE